MVVRGGSTVRGARGQVEKEPPDSASNRQEGWASLRAELFAELVDLNIDSKVGYVPSHLAMRKADDDWASQRHIVPIITVVDWNAVELEEPTDLVIAPMADTEMAKLFGIPVDDRDEEERDEANTSDNDDRELSEDVDEQLMKDGADDLDDAHDEELVHVYDKENPVIRVGKLWPNMDEFRLSFKTYAVRHQFDAKTVWTDRKKFYAKCRGFDGSGRRACKWKLPSQPVVVEQCWPTKKARVSGNGRKTSQWVEQFGAANKETDVRVHTVKTEAVVTEETDVQMHTVETEAVVTKETQAVVTVETELVVTVEFDQTKSAIEFHEVIASSPLKKTKMINELVCAVQPKTRNAKAKKGTRHGRKR
ncbi:hypothetical protein D1007_46804 [Hordeum vulgare]|nr:hypothetical protein D1007_46804 [Hordeum vulgare]